MAVWDSGPPPSNPCSSSPWRTETVQTNNAEEYGRLTQSSDYLNRHARATAAADALTGIGDVTQQVREIRDTGDQCR